MGQLFFKKRFQEAIRAGIKRTTIRRWNKPMARAGERAWSPGLGFLHIEAVEAVDLDKLSDADALTDGFETVAALKDALHQLFPDHASDAKQWFRVRFALPAAGEGAKPTERQQTLF